MDGLLARLERISPAEGQALDCGPVTLKRFPDGRSYSGDLVDNVPHGWGELTKSGGRPEYEGEWDHGLFQGKGMLTLDNGDTWEGTFRDNDMHGYGVLAPFREAESAEARGRGRSRPAFRRKAVSPPSDEAAAKEAEDKRLAPRTTLCFKGRQICELTELMHARVSVKLNKSWRTGTVVEQKPRKDGVSHLHRVRWDDAFEEKLKWWDLSAYELRLLRRQGNHLQLD